MPSVQPKLVLKEIPCELPTISLVKDSFNKMRSYVNEFNNVVTVCTKVTGQNQGSWRFEHIRKAFEKDVKPFVNTLKEYFQLFDKGLTKEVTNMREVFNQMETKVAKCFVKRKTFEIKEKELLIENDRLWELIISQDLMHTIVNTLAAMADYQKMEQSYVDEYNECLYLKAELSKKNEMVEKAHRVPDPVCNANVKHSVLNANYELICATCNECMFDAIHDLCVLYYLNDVNVRVKSKFVKSKKNKVWKPTGKVFTNVGYSWKPTGRTFTIDWNTCPLTRITSTTVVPPKKPLSTTVTKKTPPSSNTSGKLKDITNIGSSSKSKSVESNISNNSGPNKTGDTMFSLLQLLLVFILGNVRFRNDHVVEIKGYGDYQIENVMISQVKLLRSKDETLEIVIKLLKKIQVRLNAIVHNIRTDNGTGFVNQTLKAYYEDVGIAPLFPWAEAVTTACYTQNHFLIRKCYNKTPYELLQDRKPDLTYFHIFGALCYPTNIGEDLGKLKPKVDIGIFVGYAPAKKAYQIYNRRTCLIMETIHVKFDELTAMASEQFGSGPMLQHMTSKTISLAIAPRPVDPTGTPSSTSIDQDAPSTSTSSTIQETQSPVIFEGVEEQLQPAQFVDNPFLDI
ncbi:retrovirus-related pol polyprotein from transposon TNT 1-94 [Tanacetum coccineum]